MSFKTLNVQPATLDLNSQTATDAISKLDASLAELDLGCYGTVVTETLETLFALHYENPEGIAFSCEDGRGIVFWPDYRRIPKLAVITNDSMFYDVSYPDTFKHWKVLVLDQTECQYVDSAREQDLSYVDSFDSFTDALSCFYATIKHIKESK